MQNISPATLSAVTAPVRQVRMRATMALLNQQNISYSFTDLGELSTLNASPEVVASALQSRASMATLNWTRLDSRIPNRAWRLRQSVLAPATSTAVKYGYWSRSISQLDGGFNASSPWFRITFAMPTNLPGLLMVFDELSAQWCTQMNISVTSSDSVSSYTISPTAVTYQWDKELTGVLHIDFTPISWSAPNEPFRLTSLLPYLQDYEIDTDSLISVSLYEALESVDTRLSNGQTILKLILRNNENQIPIGYLRSAVTISAEYSITLPNAVPEWYPLGMYQIDTWEAKYGSSTITVEALDQFTTMSNYSVSQTQWFVFGTPREILEGVLALTRRWNGELILPPEIDRADIRGGVSLSNTHGETYRDVLKRLAICAGAYLTSSRESAPKVAIEGGAIVWSFDSDFIRENGITITQLSSARTLTIRSGRSPDSEIYAKFVGDTRSETNISWGMEFVDRPYPQDFIDRLVNMVLSGATLYVLDTRGNPALEIGDTVEFIRADGEVITGTILVADYNYNGGLSCKYTIKEN